MFSRLKNGVFSLLCTCELFIVSVPHDFVSHLSSGNFNGFGSGFLMGANTFIFSLSASTLLMLNTISHDWLAERKLIVNYSPLLVSSITSDPGRDYKASSSRGNTGCGHGGWWGAALLTSLSLPSPQGPTLRSNAMFPSGLGATHGLLRNNSMRPFGVLSGDEAVEVVGAGWGTAPKRWGMAHKNSWLLLSNHWTMLSEASGTWDVAAPYRLCSGAEYPLIQTQDEKW